MTKNDSSKTILIIVAVVVGILMIVGIIGGIGYYYLYRIGIGAINSPSPFETLPVSTDQRLPYQNARYGFSLEYPQTFSKQESQNGDGVTLTTNDPAMTIRVYGSMNALSQSLNEYLNWIRDNLSQEAEDQENAKEILSEEVPLGTAEIPAQERQWTYVDSSNGTLTFVDHVAFLKDDIFYNLQIEVAYADYDEEAAHIFDDVLASFQIK